VGAIQASEHDMIESEATVATMQLYGNGRQRTPAGSEHGYGSVPLHPAETPA